MRISMRMRLSATLLASAASSVARAAPPPPRFRAHDAARRLGATLRRSRSDGLERYVVPRATRSPSHDARIPPVIYRTFETDYLTHSFVERLNTTAVANPAMSHVFFTRKQRDAFVHETCSAQVVKAYERVVPNACKTDVFRYCLLHAHGGIYLDLGVHLEVDLMGFLHQADAANTNASFFSAKDSGASRLGLLNGVLGATARHPVLAEAMRVVAWNAETCFYGTRDLQPTGPELLGPAYATVYADALGLSGRHGLRGGVRGIDLLQRVTGADAHIANELAQLKVDAATRKRVLRSIRGETFILDSSLSSDFASQTLFLLYPEYATVGRGRRANRTKSDRNRTRAGSTENRIQRLGTTKFPGQSADMALMGYTGRMKYGDMWNQRRFWGPPCAAGSGSEVKHFRSPLHSGSGARSQAGRSNSRGTTRADGSRARHAEHGSERPTAV